MNKIKLTCNIFSHDERFVRLRQYFVNKYAETDTAVFCLDIALFKYALQIYSEGV